MCIRDSDAYSRNCAGSRNRAWKNGEWDAVRSGRIVSYRNDDCTFLTAVCDKDVYKRQLQKSIKIRRLNTESIRLKFGRWARKMHLQAEIK